MADKDGEGQSVDVGALQARIADLEAQKNNWMGKATDYEKRFKGVDPDEYIANKQALDELKRTKALADPKEMDAWKGETEKSIRASVQKELDEALNTVKALKNKNKELEVVDRVFKDIAGNFNDDCFDEVKGFIRRFCDVSEDGQIVIKDEQGATRYAQGSTSKPMDALGFGAWIASQKPSWTKPQMVKGTEGTGQARSANSSSQSVDLAKISQLSSREQQKALASLSEEQKKDLARQASGLLFGVR